LTAKDEAHEAEGSGDTNQELRVIRVLNCNFPEMKSVRVNGSFTFKLGAFNSNVLEASYEPLIADVSLLALPALME